MIVYIVVIVIKIIYMFLGIIFFIIRYCYIFIWFNLVGNLVFYVYGGDVRLVSVDVGGFFKDMVFWRKDFVFWRFGLLVVVRRVEFWMEVVECGFMCCWWWNGELGGCLDDVMLRLRDGGWGEEDVREMMMIDGGDDVVVRRRCVVGGVRDRESVVKYVRSLLCELF